MSTVLLVRHAEPLVIDGTPPDDWPLSPHGRRDATSLAAALADRSAIVVWTSPARRARDTATLAFPTVPVSVRRELSEVARPWYATGEQLEAAVAGYLRDEAVAGWEPHEDVTARLRVLDAGFGSSDGVVVVTHGLLLTTWIDNAVGLADPFEFWSALRMPDAWALDLDGRTLERIG